MAVFNSGAPGTRIPLKTQGFVGQTGLCELTPRFPPWFVGGHSTDEATGPGGSGKDVQSAHPRLDQLLQPLLWIGSLPHPAADSPVCPLAPTVCRRTNIGSRMSREAHVRIWERVGVRFPCATRHIVTDTSGLLVGAEVHPADVQDRDGAVLVIEATHQLFPWLRHLFADTIKFGHLETAWPALTGSTAVADSSGTQNAARFRGGRPLLYLRNMELEPYTPC
jgi:hypothetical protein